VGHAPPRVRLSAAVVVAGPRRTDLGPESLARWIERHAPPEARGSLAIALVTDRRMRALNRTFRGVDHPTDVLSFPAEAPPGGALAARTSRRGAGGRLGTPGRARRTAALERPPHLGDLAIAVGVAARQARAEGHRLGTELRVLALHGLLHLLGYDHEQDRGTMRAVEERLRRQAGLPTGLISRASTRATDR
jgi:probable rRNA maturation factor